MPPLFGSSRRPEDFLPPALTCQSKERRATSDCSAMIHKTTTHIVKQASRARAICVSGLG
eukprot:3965070-Heterocapsa_arctica.AAC.1